MRLRPVRYSPKRHMGSTQRSRMTRASRALIIALTVPLVGMAAVITFDEVRARGARGKLLDLRTAIASAKDRNEVNVLLQQSRADGLTLSTSRRDEWFVETPFQNRSAQLGALDRVHGRLSSRSSVEN